MKHLLGILGVLFVMALGSGQAAEVTVLKEGDSLPPVELRDQDGKTFRFDSQKGRAVVLTFVFSRCSVASFCPAMSANFSALQKALRKDAALAGKVHLVSVSIDPAFDSPKVLKQYANHFALDTSDWSFLTGNERTVASLASSFSVFVDPAADGSIDHTLTTALVGPDGKIRKLWRGNHWTPDEVLQELRKTLSADKITN